VGGVTTASTYAQRNPEEPRSYFMTHRKIDEVAADIDDAVTTVDELQAKLDQDIETTDQLDELHDTLEHATETLDDIDNSDETGDKDR